MMGRYAGFAGSWGKTGIVFRLWLILPLLATSACVPRVTVEGGGQGTPAGSWLPGLELSIQSSVRPLQSSLPSDEAFPETILLEPDEAFERAREEIDRGAWREALPYLESCCLWSRKHFDRPTCPLWLGMAYRRSGDPAQALPHFAEALENFREIASFIQYESGLAEMDLGRYGQALGRFEALASDPESRFAAPAARLRVECLWKIGRRVEAGEELRRLLGLQPEKARDPGLLWLKARMARESGDLVVEIDILRNLDLYHVDAPEHPEVSARLQELRLAGHSIDPPYGKAAVEYVSRLYWTGRLDEAEQVVERIRARVPEGHPDYDPDIDRDLHLVVADSLVRQQNYKESLNIFRKRGDLKGMAKAYSRLGKLDKASRTYERLAEKKNGRAAETARFLAAWILGEDQRFGEAYEKLSEYLKTARNGKAKALWFAGWYAYREGRYPEAIEHWDTLRKRYRRSGYRRAAKYYIARAKLHMGEAEKAMADLLDLATQSRFSYYRLAAAFRLRIEEEGRNEVYRHGGRPDQHRTWRKIRKKYRKWSPWNEDDMAQTMRDWLDEADVSRPDMRAAREKLERIARKKEVFPHLSASLAWHRLGVEQEAREELRLHLRALSKAMKYGEKPVFGETQKQTAHRIARRAAMVESRAELAWSLLLYARSIGDEALAYRVAVEFLRGRELRKFDPKGYLRYRYPVAYFETIRRYARQYGVPLELALAIMRTESGFRPDVVSNVGAVV